MKFRETCLRLWQDDQGQDIIEYALLAVFISIIAVAVIQSIGTDVNALYSKIDGATTSASN